MNKEVMVVESNLSVLGQSFNIYGDFENPLFLAKDVAEWIEYGEKNAYRLYDAVDENERMTCSTNLGGQVREVKMLTEDGVYEVLMQSTKTIAKLFKAEVKKLLKGLRTKKLAVVEVKQYTVEELLRMQLAGIEKQKELEAQVKQAIREKGQISNEREASVMGKLGVATKKINALEGELKELKAEPDNTIVGFTLLHKLQVARNDLSVYGRTLTKICRDKGVKVKTIQVPGEKYPTNVYPTVELITYFTSLGFIL